jgi:hypothetical protein
MPYNTSIVANSDLVSSCHGTFNTKTSSVTTQTEIIIYSQTDKIHPLQNQMRLIACRLSGEGEGISRIAINILLASWRRSTQKQYATYIVNGFCSVTKGRLIQFKPSFRIFKFTF